MCNSFAKCMLQLWRYTATFIKLCAQYTASRAIDKRTHTVAASCWLPLLNICNMQGNVSNAQTISIYNTPDPAADLETGMQLLLHEFGSNNQPTVVTKALPRPVTVVSLEFELAQEFADRSSIDKQIQELTAELTVKDTCIIAKADALNVERHHYGLPIKPRNDAGYGIDSFNLSTIGDSWPERTILCSDISFFTA